MVKQSRTPNRKPRHDRYCTKRDTELMYQYLVQKSDYVIDRLRLSFREGKHWLERLTSLKEAWPLLPASVKHEKITHLISEIDNGHWPLVKTNFRRFKHARANQAVYLPRSLIEQLAAVPGDDYAQKVETLLGFFNDN